MTPPLDLEPYASTLEVVEENVVLQLMNVDLAFLLETVDSRLADLSFADLDGQVAAGQVPQAAVTQYQGVLSIGWGQLTGVPTTLAGYGITDAVSNAELAAWPGSANITTVGALSAGAVPASLITAGAFGAGNYTVTGALTVTGPGRFGPATIGAASTFEISKLTGAASTDPLVLALRSTRDANDWSTSVSPIYIDFQFDDTTAPGPGSRARIGVISQFASGAAGQLGFWVGSQDDLVLAVRMTRSAAGTSTITFLGAPTADISMAAGDASSVVRNTAQTNDTTSTASLRLRPDTRGSGSVHGGVTMYKEIADWSVTNNRDAGLGFFTIENDVRVEKMRLNSSGDLGIAAGRMLYLDGVPAAGDTYIQESAGNTLALVAGGVTALALTTAAANFGVPIQRGGNQVLTTRRTGWTTVPTGTLTRTTFDTATVTLPQLAERVAALIVDMHSAAGHGAIGP